MMLGVYDQTEDRTWLRSAVPAIERYYDFWTTGPHAIPGVGLSRYFDLGEGPAPEVVSDEKDADGRTHYDRVREYYRTHDVADYDVGLYYDRARDRLTDLFYKGDRSMRESGFDPSNRFGPFSVDIIHYAPVCLNSLLYVMEEDAARITETLGDAAAARDMARPRGTTAGAGQRAALGRSAGCTTTTTSGPDSCGATISRRRSTRCGRASRRRSKRHACARTCRSSKRQVAC